MNVVSERSLNIRIGGLSGNLRGRPFVRFRVLCGMETHFKLKIPYTVPIPRVMSMDMDRHKWHNFVNSSKIDTMKPQSKCLVSR